MSRRFLWSLGTIEAAAGGEIDNYLSLRELLQLRACNSTLNRKYSPKRRPETWNNCRPIIDCGRPNRDGYYQLMTHPRMTPTAAQSLHTAFGITPQHARLHVMDLLTSFILQKNHGMIEWYASTYGIAALHGTDPLKLVYTAITTTNETAAECVKKIYGLVVSPSREFVVELALQENFDGLRLLLRVCVDHGYVSNVTGAYADYTSAAYVLCVMSSIIGPKLTTHPEATNVFTESENRFISVLIWFFEEELDKEGTLFILHTIMNTSDHELQDLSELPEFLILWMLRRYGLRNNYTATATLNQLIEMAHCVESESDLYPDNINTARKAAVDESIKLVRSDIHRRKRKRVWPW